MRALIPHFLLSNVSNKLRIFKKSDHSNCSTVAVLIVAEHNDDVHDDGNSQNLMPFCFPFPFALICLPHFHPEQTYSFHSLIPLHTDSLRVMKKNEKKSFDAMT